MTCLDRGGHQRGTSVLLLFFRMLDLFGNSLRRTVQAGSGTFRVQKLGEAQVLLSQVEGVLQVVVSV